MTKETSVYLNLVRFFAAFVVFIVHSHVDGISGGFLSRLSNFGQTAVMVFFVLSGYVISYVSSAKEKNLPDYTYARISRIYSIVLPAIILTLLLNSLGDLYISSQYKGPWQEQGGLDLSKYIATLFMAQNLWDKDLVPPNNGPFWSISFEVIYYILFAIAFYLKGSTRVFLMVLVTALAGPTIVALFPVWLLGYFAYSLQSKKIIKLNTFHATILFIFGLTLLVLSSIIRRHLDMRFPMIFRTSLLGDYIDGMAFTLNVFAAPTVLINITKAFEKLKKPAYILSSLTFPLYLFHMPLVRFFAGISPYINEPGSLSNRIFVFSMTFFVIALIGFPAERSKTIINTSLRRLTALLRRWFKIRKSSVVNDLSN